MTNTSQSSPSLADTLSIYIPMDRRQALAHGRTIPEHAYGVAVMADISGFTPLTDAMVKALGPKRGAEELPRQLNKVYDALIAEVDRYGGSVLGFAGDAITCWFDAEDDGIARAAAATVAMQSAMHAFAAVPTPSGQTVELAVKISMATGPIRRFLVGDPAEQVIDAPTGATLDRMAAGEHTANKGEVILDSASVEALDARVQIREWRTEHDQPFAVLANLTTPIATRPWPTLPPDAIGVEHGRQWMLPLVYERMASGQGEFLAELRPTSPVFLRFGGIDYDQDPEAGTKLNDYICWVQGVVRQHGGSLLQLTFGDKGSYLYITFGAPQAHEDDTVRAVAAAHVLRARTPLLDRADESTPAVQIGVTRGLMRVGAYGGVTRRTYAVLGDEVNMAARLMQGATPGEVCASGRVFEATKRQFDFHFKGAFQVKGRAEPQPIYSLRDRRMLNAWQGSWYERSLVGRQRELTWLAGHLDAAYQGRGQVLHIEGPAGIGKSHLAAESAQRAQQRGFRVVGGVCQSATQSTPFVSWRQVVASLLNLTLTTSDPEQTELHRQLATLAQDLGHTHPDWVARWPLLGDVLGVALPDNATTAHFERATRQNALTSLLVEIVLAATAQQPLLVIFEDIHWMDEASLMLTVALARMSATHALALMLVQRPTPDTTLLPEDVTHFSLYRHLLVGELSPQAVSDLVAERLGGAATPLALGLINARAQGSPILTEALVDSLHESGGIIAEDGQWNLAERLISTLESAQCVVMRDGVRYLSEQANLHDVNIGLPDSIYGIVLERLDRLPESYRLTLKVASVMGRMFNLDVLIHVHPLRTAPAALEQELREIQERDFVRSEDKEINYLFKHNITQEVAYETLLFDQRRQLHAAVASCYENLYAGTDFDPTTLPSNATESTLAPHYAVLAHHWELSENRAREWYYSVLAGEQAAAQCANAQAVRYFTRALELADSGDAHPKTLFRLHAGRELVYDLNGDRTGQLADIQALERLAADLHAPHLQAQAALRRAHYARVTSDYPAAWAAAQAAAQYARAVPDAALELEADLMGGRVLWQKGDFDDAARVLDQALANAQAQGNRRAEADATYFRAMVYWNQDQLAETHTFNTRARELYRAIEHREGEARCLGMAAILYSEAGDYSASRTTYEQARERYHGIGHRRGEAIALTNLGADWLDLGDYAAAVRYEEECLETWRAIGDRWGEALSLDTLGLALLGHGDLEAARTACAQALTLQSAIGDRRGAGFSQTHLGHILAAQEAWAAARDAYQAALITRRAESEGGGGTMDTLAGLARATLGTGERAQATIYALEVLDWLAANGLNGVEYPLRVYAACHSVLAASPDDPMLAERAIGAHLAAHDVLHERAGRIQDESLRAQYVAACAAVLR